MMENKSILATLKKNAMLIILVLVYLFFLILTKGSIFNPSSFTELINQNAYVFILGCGMLMCMLTGGNIDLSVGAFVCLLGAFGGVFMIVQGLGTGISILLMLLIGVVYGVFRISGFPRSRNIDSFQEFQNRISGTVSGQFPESFLWPCVPIGKGCIQLGLLYLWLSGSCHCNTGCLYDQKQQTEKRV